MKKTNYEKLKDSMNERYHRKELVEEFQQCVNKWQFLVDHPAVFGTNGLGVNPLSYPNILLQNGTLSQTVTSGANQLAESSTAFGFNPPYIFSIQYPTSFPNTAFAVGIASSTINYNGANLGTWSGATFGVDSFILVVNSAGAGSGIGAYQTTNNVATKTNVVVTDGVAASVSGDILTFREYTPGTVQWIFTNSQGIPISTIGGTIPIPTTWTTLTNVWTNPSTQRCVFLGCINNTTTVTMALTPSTLVYN